MSKHEIKCPKCGMVFEIDEMSYADIAKQIRDSEFSKDLNERIHVMEKEKQNAVDLAKARTEQSLQENLNRKTIEINNLQSSVRNLEEKLRQAEMNKSQAVELAEVKIKDALNEKIAKSEAEVSELRVKLANEEKNVISVKEGYEARLKLQDEQIERLKDMKLKLSTKAVGESLEQFCMDEFNKVRAMAFPQAYFDKDNLVSKQSGSKGDFIFRDPAEGVESVSIMFEMKNENEATKAKHKNEDFLAELDKDRREKNCEYAVLVSMLEADSDYYNQGIVDVSHKFPKMFVIRPHFFIPLISLLKNAAEKSLAVKEELALAKSQNIDITNFENDLNDWKISWAANIKNAAKKHNDAIEQIDKAIADLKKVRDFLMTSDRHLGAAEGKLEKLTIKKLTAKNPTMKAKFDELQESNR